MTVVRRTLPAAVIACALGLLAQPAAAVDDGEVLALTLQELAKPSVRALPPQAQAQRLGIAASGPGSLIREDGRVMVEARFDQGAMARLPALEAAGGEVVASSREYQLATVSVPYGKLRQLAEVPGLRAVTPVRAPVLREVEPDCQGGSVISEGVAQLKVAEARAALEGEGEPSKEGEGLTVGILSDSFEQATEAVGGGPIATVAAVDVAAKELPGQTNTCAGQGTAVKTLNIYEYDPLKGPPPTDEGRAMAQIVHDVVPKANLAFHSAFNSELDFAQGIERLAAPEASGGAEADVIVDDVGWFGEPFFQDGPIAAAINKVVSEGVTYLTSAGNDNLFSGEDEIASWEAPQFRDSGNCPLEVRKLPSFFKATHCLDFNPLAAVVDRTFGIKVKAGHTLTVDLQWAEPWYGVKSDLDAFLLDYEGRLVAVSSEDNGATQRPVEIVQWTNSSDSEQVVQLVVNRFSGGQPRLKLILLQNGDGVSGTEYPRSGGGDVVGPAIYGHAGADAAITVGAVPYNNSNRVERYSSRGPVTHYFGPVEGTKPAPELGAPEAISKPDLAATDCGKTTFFSFQPASEPGTWRFCGTSAAAPHAAGIAAIALEAGAAGPDEVGEMMTGTATPLGMFGACAAGAGLVNAVNLVEALAGGATTAAPTCPPPNAEDEVERAPGDWGLEQPPEEPQEPEQPQEPKQPEVPPNNPPSSPPPEGPASQPEAAQPQRTIPRTHVRTRPPRVVRTRRALARVVLRFGSTPAGGTFRCQIDGSAWRACRATVTRWFGLGPHVVRVQARSGDGSLDPSPAVIRFRVAPTRQAAARAHRSARR